MIKTKLEMTMYLYLLQSKLNKADVKIRKKPNEGRYVRCSKITSLIGMIPDSIDSVRKNQKMPNDMSLFFLKRNTPRMINERRTMKLSSVLISKNPFEIGKS